MAFETNHFFFLHFPKCGGTFIKSILSHYCSLFNRVAPSHTPPEKLKIPVNKPWVCFMREPSGWVESYFTARLKTGWSPLISDYSREFDSDCKCDDIDEFVEKMVEYHPNFLNDMYLQYNLHCDIIYPFDTIRKSIHSLLSKFKITDDFYFLYQAPILNESKNKKVMSSNSYRNLAITSRTAFDIHRSILNA